MEKCCICMEKLQNDHCKVLFRAASTDYFICSACSRQLKNLRYLAGTHDADYNNVEEAFVSTLNYSDIDGQVSEYVLQLIRSLRHTHLAKDETLQSSAEDWACDDNYEAVTTSNAHQSKPKRKIKTISIVFLVGSIIAACIAITGIILLCIKVKTSGNNPISYLKSIFTKTEAESPSINERLPYSDDAYDSDVLYETPAPNSTVEMAIVETTDVPNITESPSPSPSPTPKQTPTSSPTAYIQNAGYVISNELALRKQPSKDSAARDTLHKGDVVSLKKKVNGFYYVYIPLLDKEGYVLCRWIETEYDSNVPRVKTPAPEKPVSTPSQSFYSALPVLTSSADIAEYYAVLTPNAGTTPEQ